MKARPSTPRVNPWEFALSSVLGGVAACGGHAYDPDVDGQSHWWLTCAEDAECGPGLGCICGACTEPCEAHAECALGETRAACVSPPGWCEAPSNAMCAARCERPTDCPAAHRCEESVCVPTPATTNASTPDAAALADAGCAGCATASDAGERTSPDASSSECGDGIVQVDGDEQCDDGNAVDLDGCSHRCTLESEYPCATDAGVCFASCGDGILSPNETCDDGNGLSADGCSARCTVEAGYVCAVPGAPCVDTPSP